MINDYIDNTIKHIEDRIAEAEEMLTFLKAQRASVIQWKSLGEVEPVKPWFYMVRSRSGGMAHYIERSSDGSYTCMCAAGVQGRVCWAIKGVRSEVENSNPVGLPSWNDFSDEKGEKHEFGFSQEGWYDAGKKFNGFYP